MAIQIIGAGFGRTGTTSTKLALEKLGFRTYHMKEVPKNKGHGKFWGSVADDLPGAAYAWSELFKDYDATLDFPASAFWREQMAAFPDAKVLLTLHPKGGRAWHTSCVETIYGIGNLRWSKILAYYVPLVRSISRYMRKRVWGEMLHGTMNDPVAAVTQYERHIEEVRAAVPAEKLLVYSVIEGWEPLCKFLGVPVPEEDFPKVNDTREMQRLFLVGAIIAYSLLAISLVLGGYMIYLLGRILLTTG